MSESVRSKNRVDLGLAVAASVLAGVACTAYGEHVVVADDQNGGTVCTVAANYPEPLGPYVDLQVIQKQLRLTPSQMRFVHVYAAICSTPLSPEQFRHGVQRSPDLYSQFGIDYDRCAVYGIAGAKQPIPTPQDSPDETAPAILACADLPYNNHQHTEQI